MVLMERPFTQSRYMEHQVRDFLANYVGYSQGAVRPKRDDDPLVQRAAPAHEAPWASRAVVWADMERALDSCGFDGRIAFLAVSMGNTGWRRGHSVEWREKIGDAFGMTGGEVTGCVTRTVERMLDFLNGR